FWIGEWHKLWNTGILYARWMPDSFGGFGAPSFYFYPPLSFFLSSALYALVPGFSPAEVGKLLGIIVTVLSGLSMWLYLRWRPDGKNTFITILGALLYAFAPYRLFDYSVRGAISEHLAFVWVPLAFWGLDLMIQRRKPRDRFPG